MLITTIGYVLAGLVGAGIIFVGVRFLLAPRAAAAGYGIAGEPERGGTGAYLSVKGVRDIGSGLIVLALIANGAPTRSAGRCSRPRSCPSATG